MPRIRVLFACCVAALALALPAPTASALSPHQVAVARQMVNEVNAFRARHGRSQLRFSPSLTRSSYRYSRRMLRRNYFGHTARIQASRRFRPLGETISMHRGWRTRVRGTVRRWARSAGHRSLLLNARFRYAGAGKAKGRFGRRLATTWTLQLGRL